MSRALGRPTFRGEEAEGLAKECERKQSGKWEGNQETANRSLGVMGSREKGGPHCTAVSSSQGQASPVLGNERLCSVAAVSIGFGTRGP